MISNSDSHFLDLEYSSRGEYKNKSLLVSNIQNDTLYIKEKTTPTSLALNDKLSVHKNHSTSLTLLIPKNLSVILNVNNSTTNVSGNFSTFKLYQSLGEIYLSDWNNSAIIQTLSAHITLINSKAKVIANQNENSNCIKTNSSNVVNISSVSGKIRCVVF